MINLVCVNYFTFVDLTTIHFRDYTINILVLCGIIEEILNEE